MSSQGSIMDQPMDSIQRILSGNGLKGLSANMKTTVSFIRGQITRSFTAAGKKLDAAKIYMNDPDVNRNEKELRKIEVLRKEVMMFQSIIDSDAHFIELINKRDVILSDKERNALKLVIASYFEEKPRADVIRDLKIANDELRAILVSQEFKFAPLLSDAELAELSHDLASFLDDNDDKSDNGAEDIEGGERDNNRHSQNASKDTPILVNAVPSAIRSTASITMAPSSNGGLIENTDQPVVPPQINQLNPPLQGPIARESIHDPDAQYTHQPTPLLKEASVRSCPCCKQDHELYSCEHKNLRKFCALNGLCIYCTSNEHKSIECDLNSQKSSSAHSVVSHRSHRSEPCLTPPQKAFTPFGCGNAKPDQPTRVSMRKMAQRERASQEKRPFRSAFSRLDEKPEFRNSKDANNREHYESRNTENNDDSIKLSFKEVLAIVAPFEGDPLDFPRFKAEFNSMVMLNNQLNDTMRFAVLKKKLVGEAREYIVALYYPEQAVYESLEAMRKAFSEDNTAMNSVLQSFRELTFNTVDFRQTESELNKCKSILLQMKELGLDTESNTFVRTFVAKIPDKILRELRVLFVNGKEPSMHEVLAHFTETLNDLTFFDKFKSGIASSQDRAKELTNSIMALDASSPQNLRQKKQSTTSAKNDSKTQNPSNPKNQKAAAGKTNSNGSGQLNVAYPEFFRDSSETHE